MTRNRAPTKAEELRWRAEDVVRKAIEKTPNYKKAVNQTIKNLKQTEKKASTIIKKKNSGRGLVSNAG